MSYNRFVEEMLQNSKRLSDAIEGWDGKYREAIPCRVEEFNGWIDPWNPLYNDENYAAKTKYGKKIAFPMFYEALHDTIGMPAIDPKAGYTVCQYCGEDHEIYKPVYPGEKYKIVHRPTTFHDLKDVDTTIPEELKGWKSDQPVFSYVEVDMDVLDEKDELVAKFKHLNDCLVVPELPKPENGADFKDHYYTDEDHAYIDSVIAGEKIQGSTRRYFEDVKIGDKLEPTTLGPMTLSNVITYFGMRHEMPYVTMRRYKEICNPGQMIRDPQNADQCFFLWHYNEWAAANFGSPRNFMYGNSARMEIARMISNWMGDDGEITEFKWRHLTLTMVGDTRITRGRVIGKKVVNGEGYVLIDAFLDNMCRGYVSEAAVAWVKLPMRNSNVQDMYDVPEEDNPFTPGKRVRFKQRTQDFLPSIGFPLAGKTGTVMRAHVPWQLDYMDVKGYVSVLCDDPIPTGRRLVINKKDLELID